MKNVRKLNIKNKLGQYYNSYNFYGTTNFYNNNFYNNNFYNNNFSQIKLKIIKK